MNPQTHCSICGKTLIKETEAGWLVCPVHSTRGVDDTPGKRKAA